MKSKTLTFCLLVSAFCLRTSGQSYSLDWFKVSGGGGNSTNGQYAVKGTLGQPDAGGTMSDANHSLTGGFWSLIGTVPTPDAPRLFIHRTGSQVTIYWQNTGTWTLQQNTDLYLPAGWRASGGVVTANGTNSLTLNNPSGNLFFRLKQ